VLRCFLLEKVERPRYQTRSRSLAPILYMHGLHTNLYRILADLSTLFSIFFFNVKEFRIETLFYSLCSCSVMSAKHNNANLHLRSLFILAQMDLIMIHLRHLHPNILAVQHINQDYSSFLPNAANLNQPYHPNPHITQTTLNPTKDSDTSPNQAGYDLQPEIAPLRSGFISPLYQLGYVVRCRTSPLRPPR
jgi:hypothetical protein